MFNSRLRELLRAGVPAKDLHFHCCPQGGKGSAPPAPDYAGAAAQQGAASQAIATQQTAANRPNQYTPWGSSTWQSNATVDPSTGQPVTQWTQNQNLDPKLQGALDQQLGIQQDRSNLAGGFINRVQQDYSQPFNWNSLPQMSGAPQATQTGAYGLDKSAPQQTTQTANEPGFSADRQRIEQGLFDRMQPIHDRQEESTRTRLMNQGFTQGSEGYNRELERLHQNQAGEQYNAMQTAGTEQQRMQQMLLGQQQQAFGQDATSQQAQNQAYGQQFQQDLGSNAQNFGQNQQQAQFQNQLRQQAIAEQAQRRGMSLNELNALLTGQQVGTPQMPSFMGAAAGQTPNFLNAAQSAGQYGMQGAQMQNQADAGLWGGLGQLAGTGAMLFAMSDRRLKTNLRHVGWHRIGVPIYDYDIDGRRERGVMAQDMLQVAPQLVSIHPNGYLMVNYGGLNAAAV